MSERISVSRVEFSNFKALKRFSLTLGKMNLLVGPNNSGKSTILNAFRVLEAGLRRANARRPEIVPGPEDNQFGYPVPIDDLPLSLENVPTDYDTGRPSTVRFTFSNDNILLLNFLASGGASLIPIRASRAIRSPAQFKAEFPIVVGFIPVLGPFEDRETLLDQRTVQRGLSTHRASAHFRNYWHYFPEGFEDFASLLRDSWPGMDIQRPEFVEINVLAMFCIEKRITREIYWAGFGFQVWCQILTHIVRNRGADLLVVDEPDIYLHPDHERQSLLLLRNASPDVLLATHSTEMINEADPSELLLVNKERRSAKRMENVDQVQHVLDLLGSSQNLTLTRLARTRKVLFVEGSDFRILGRFANKLGLADVANQSNFTVVPVEGFDQWEKIKSLAWGFERTIGQPLEMGAVFDRDYRCEEEIEAILGELNANLQFAHIHSRKEIENFLLVEDVLDKAIKKRTLDIARRKGTEPAAISPAREILDEITSPIRGDVQSKYIDYRVQYFKSIRSPLSGPTVTRQAIEIFEKEWIETDKRMRIAPGKQVLALLNRHLQDNHGLSLTMVSITGAFTSANVPNDLVAFLRKLSRFQAS